jgi:cellulose synthase/poly-beta-1,6-N-acetylglucosamine synthase-like glycosyltransferase
MIVFFVAMVIGVGTLFWSTIGILRFVGERRKKLSPGMPNYGHFQVPLEGAILPSEVAILMAAHNEDLVIRETISAAMALVPAGNIHIVSDGSTDGTVQACRESGARVLDLVPNRGKAGALFAGIEHFSLAARYKVVLLLDADTRLASDYLSTGLPAFRDPTVVAVAGRVKTSPLPPPTHMGRFLVAYRERFYQVVQLLHKYGQAAASANVVSIVPGFASMYRASVLKDINVTAPGLVIEDFNMTFELHAKKLGRIYFHPNAAVAYTQDPDNLRDYVRQMHRWNLGFWQTVRLHGLQKGRFWIALGVHIFELVSNSIMLVLLIPLLLLSTYLQFGLASSGDPPLPAVFASGVVRPQDVVLGVLLPDFMFSILAAIVLRRPAYLVLGLVFPLMRVVDASICLVTLPKAWFAHSSGSWASPARRPQSIKPPAQQPSPSRERKAPVSTTRAIAAHPLKTIPHQES